MDKRTEISTAMKEALKNKDKIALATIRLIMAALKDRDIAERENGQADGVSDAMILLMLQSMVKQRQESSKTYSEAGRDDLAEREETEIDVIRTFMPKQLSDDEVSEIIDGIIADLGADSIKDMGKIMGVLRADYAGQVDMGKAGGVTKVKLA
ncbi:MAG: glutamyl-tRNA amidotransferase [Alphaproteobacteria bacterium]|nr:MAG: glutamyl-tRNA amidotransferase [Alphaproteobacteria bacterium]